jgi:hypothetical protein
MGDQFSKYKAKYRTDGRLCLPDLHDDLICSLLADGESDEEIIKLADTDQAEIDRLRSDLFAQRRVRWLKDRNNKEDREPKTPDECLAFVKSRLVSLAKNADGDKPKIDALTALAKVAIEEKKHGSDDGDQSVPNPALEKLKLLRSEGDGSGS